VADFDAALTEYSSRLGTTPDAVVTGRYARWRTDLLNFTISCKPGQPGGIVRHIGFEDDREPRFREEKDGRGITWEYFSLSQQDHEIEERIGPVTKS
jgi:hypothetical protein